MRVLAVVTLCSGLFLSSVAFAQASPPAAASVAPATASPEAVALARRYLAAMHMDASMKPMLLKMTDAMVRQEMARYPNLDDGQRKRLADAISSGISETYDHGMLDRMAEKMVPGMAIVFTQGELKALAEFYESPVGQSIIAKMPAFGEISGKAVIEMMPELQAEMQGRIQKNIEALKLSEKAAAKPL